MLSILATLDVYSPGDGRYRVDTPCPAPVAVSGGTRPCGSHTIDAVTGRCARLTDHPDH